MSRPVRRVWTLGGAALVGLSLTSCASLSPDAGAAASVVSHFSEALAAGDRVIVEGRQKVSEGTRVKVG